LLLKAKMPLNEFLKEWVVNYARSKDVFKKTIIEIKKDISEVVIIHKHKEEKYFIDPFLEKIEKNLREIKEDSDAFFVCMNTVDNLKKLLAMWNELIRYRHLCFIFLNPFSRTEKLWTIFPYTHNKIADESSLKTGIQSMFEQVEPIDRKEVEKMYENE